jgi:hypothetical protein
MSDAKDLETLVLDAFAFLEEEWGFNHPVLTHERWSTTIAYLSKEIGIEIELDWRDLDVFILVTRLDQGKLPKGYYVSDGQTRRIHLEHVLQKYFNVSPSAIKEFPQFDRKKRQQRNRQAMEERVAAYQQLLRNYIGMIINAGENLFQ